jgi:hypothetical protein
METANEFESGMYYDYDLAEARVRQLQDLGYSDKEISVMMRDKEKATAFVERSGGHAAEGAVTGGVIGGGVGALVAGLMATGSIVAIAGTGGVAAPLVIGPLAAALAGLGAGATTGGVIGALVGAGIPKEKARAYDEGLDKGGVLIGVYARPENREKVREVFAD